MKTPQRTKSLPVPCSAWAKQLAALHPGDLTPDEQRDLQHHIANCSNCAAVYAAYQAVDAHILSLPAVQPSAQQIARLEALITDQTHNNSHWEPAAIAQELPALPSRIPKRLARIEHRASLLAAVLIVMVLAGSALALFSARHASNSGGIGTSGVIYAVSSAGTVYAVDAGSGKTIWSTPLHTRASWQFLVSRGRIFIGSSDYYLYALRTDDGQLLWKRSYKDLTTVGNQAVQIAPYPASDGNTIYFGTPKGIYAWSATDGRQVWSYPAPASFSALSRKFEPEVATVNNGIVYAYLAFHNGLYALNAASGSLRWKNAQVPSDTSLVVVRNHIYFASYGGAMRVLQADSGQLLNTPGLPRVSPFNMMITDGDTVYLRSGIPGYSEDVYAVRSSDDTVLWHKHYELLSFSGVRNGSLYYISIRSFCAVSARDGSMQWCRQLPRYFTPELAIANQGTLYITASSKLEAIRLSDGKVLWVALENVSLARIELD